MRVIFRKITDFRSNIDGSQILHVLLDPLDDRSGDEPPWSPAEQQLWQVRLCQPPVVGLNRLRDVGGLSLNRELGLGQHQTGLRLPGSLNGSL